MLFTCVAIAAAAGLLVTAAETGRCVLALAAWNVGIK